MYMWTLTSIKCLCQNFSVFFVFEHELNNFIAIDAIKTKQLNFWWNAWHSLKSNLIWVDSAWELTLKYSLHTSKNDLAVSSNIVFFWPLSKTISKSPLNNKQPNETKLLIKQDYH